MTKPISDFDGNELPAPEPGSDLANLLHVMMFGRRNQIQIGPYVRIGNITIQVRDLTQRPQEGGVPDVPPWELAGAEGG